MKSYIFKAQSFIIISFLILYVGANYLLGEQAKGGIITLFKSLLLLIFFLISRTQRISINIRPLNFFIMGLLSLMILQLIFIQNFEVIKIIGLNLLTFLLFAFWGNEKLLNIWLWGIKFSAFIASLSVAYLAYKWGDFAYLRSEAIIDKQYITVLDSIAFIAIMCDLKFNRKIVVNVLLFITIFLVDLLIVQSKLSLFVLGVYIVGNYFFKRIPSIKEIFKVVLIFALSFYLLQMILPKDSVVLDPIKQGVNQLVGTEVLDIQRKNIRTDTYDIRSELWRYCLQDIFPNHPFIGIGLGNFGEYAKKGKNMINKLEETESSFLSVITEGGLFYMIIFLSFIYLSLSKAYKQLNRRLNYIDYFIFFFYLSYFILFIGNDFLDSLFWIQSGLVSSILFKKTNINKLRLH